MLDQPTATTDERTEVPEVVTTTIDIVVPVYNEERALPGCVEVLHEYLTHSMPFEWVITIADNASTDRTAAVAAQLADRFDRVRVLTMRRKGRGLALRQAWSTSDADIVAYMDVDLSTGLEALLPLVASLVEGHSDVAIGTRLAAGAHTVRGMRREVISRAYNTLIHLLHGARFSDAQCGFKAARTSLVRELLPHIRDNGWFFDTELLLLAEHNGLRIHEVPVDWVEDTDSRVDVSRTAVDDIRGLLRVARAKVTGEASVPELPQRPEPRAAHPDAVTARPKDQLLAQIVAFAIIGVLSTVAHALLFGLLRAWWPAMLANLVALTVTTVLNTEANRRFTFPTANGPAGRVHLQGLAVFAMYYAVTSGSLLLLHLFHPGATRSVEIVVVLVSSIVGTVLRFAALRAWVFRTERTATASGGKTS